MGVWDGVLRLLGHGVGTQGEGRAPTVLIIRPILTEALAREMADDNATWHPLFTGGTIPSRAVKLEFIAL